MAAPATHCVKSDDVHIADQVLGNGPLDLVFVPGFVSHVEASCYVAERSAFFRRLASFSRLILFDKRGTGMSDRGSQIFTLEQHMHDVQTILEKVGSKRAVLFGASYWRPLARDRARALLALATTTLPYRRCIMKTALLIAAILAVGVVSADAGHNQRHGSSFHKMHRVGSSMAAVGVPASGSLGEQPASALYRRNLRDSGYDARKNFDKTGHMCVSCDHYGN
ncbi:alpha/beta fold hydrolase [Bradyrhizobium forestalis]|uniref:alpha/beta fold hydrolase n=1 Tax=Bradyrhizobium forestalis TaxID=1419263 RepID=UPI001ABF7E7C|nr:alpha/beta hydrolase [Bradyrhizobium forestalis]